MAASDSCALRNFNGKMIKEEKLLPSEIQTGSYIKNVSANPNPV